jgi:hypothetical protein
MRDWPQDSCKSGHEEPLNDLRHGVDVMKYQEVREQVIVIVHLVILMANVFLNPPVVEGFTFYRLRLEWFPASLCQ